MLQGDADSVFLSEEIQSFLLDKECDLQTSPPIRSNDWMSPYELVFGEKPDYKRLNPFYCPGLYYVCYRFISMALM
jgi:hypothetical protein